jgi:hypothetical protein
MHPRAIFEGVVEVCVRVAHDAGRQPGRSSGLACPLPRHRLRHPALDADTQNASLGEALPRQARDGDIELFVLDPPWRGDLFEGLRRR